MEEQKRNTRRTLHTLLCFLCLLIGPASSAHHSDWDGIVVTQSDYQALQAIKNELVDPIGVLRSWNTTGAGACSGGWAGIKCVQGQVIAIQLPWRGLGGRISEKIGQLQALRKLSLHDNALTGAVPWSLGFLPNLRGVYLFNNRLTGSVPPSIGNCLQLQTLDLSNNALSGTIPASLANSTRLIRLNISFNSFSGSIPASLTQNPSIVVLALEHNNISGQIPNSWGGGTAGNTTYQLRTLTLGHNLISGSIPSSFGKLHLLERVSLSSNQIGGVIPGELGELSRLQELDLAFNAINGTLPASVSNMSSLVVLDIEGNRLTDRIPENWNQLQNLSVLNLKNNHFQGGIPSSIGNISQISHLDFSQNNFTGEIPASLANLSNLTSFNVSYNNLSGPVPSRLSEKFNSSSFVGNIQLCGYTGSVSCPPPNSSISIAPAPEPSVRHKRKLSTKDIILIAAGILLAVLLLLCCILLCCLIRKKAAAKKKNGKSPKSMGISEKAISSGVEIESGGDTGGKLVHFDGPFVFTADDLLCATAEIMGKSSYGTAYKATLEDGNQVAVKRLREKTTKGQREFENEVAGLGRIRHPNLLALRAYYLGPKGEKLLVFDYMPKGSLASFLHARGPETAINWPTRMNIAAGVARGLNHLHTEENIVHGNLTSSNILLDEQTNTHIADYGLSRLMTSAAATTTVVATAGTVGYAAPELSKTKKPTTKTDVYSFGVVMLELLTGKSPSEGTNGEDLPQWVASIVKEEWTNEVFDLELMRDTPSIGDELLNTLKLALHCVDPSPAARPEVQQVLQQLEEIMPEIAAKPGNEGTEGAEIPPATE